MAHACCSHDDGRTSHRYWRPVLLKANRYRPSGVNSGSAGRFGTPGSGAPIGFCVLTSYMRTVPSAPPVASVRLSGLVEAPVTSRVCPMSGREAGFHVLVDHSLVQPLKLPPIR